MTKIVTKSEYDGSITESHDTFLIEYTGRSLQDPGNSNCMYFYDEELQQKVIENMDIKTKNWK